MAESEINTRLNEYETLKDENEQWEDAFNFFVMDTAQQIQERIDRADIPRKGIEGAYKVTYLWPSRLETLIDRHETLKKATDALSAERAGKMADEMETGRRISTSRHIRELRAYVEILEGK